MADFDIACACGETLTGDFYSPKGSIGTTLEVEHCSKCKDNNYNEGYEEGHEEGFEAGTYKGRTEAEAKYDDEMVTWAKVKDRITG